MVVRHLRFLVAHSAATAARNLGGALLIDGRAGWSLVLPLDLPAFSDGGGAYSFSDPCDRGAISRLHHEFRCVERLPDRPGRLFRANCCRNSPVGGFGILGNLLGAEKLPSEVVADNSGAP